MNFVFTGYAQISSSRDQVSTFSLHYDSDRDSEFCKFLFDIAVSVFSAISTS